MYKKDSFHKPEKTYLQDRLTLLLPTLMQKVIQVEDGKFMFTHATFPDLQVQGITISSIQENLERAIKKQLKGKSDKHVDYLLNLLIK